MYTRSKQFIKSGSNISPSLFVENNDIHNSELLYRLDNITDRKLYQITKFENRIDLISNDIYKTDDYSWILLYINRVNVEDLVRGTYLEYIDESVLKNLISSI